MNISPIIYPQPCRTSRINLFSIMDAVTLMMQVLKIGILLSLISATAGQQSCRCVEQEENGYLFCSCRKTWEQARLYCEDAYKGQLALITDDSIQAIVKTLLDANSASDTWVGARGEVGDWRWVHDGRPISYQGCYQDDPNSRDLNFDIGLGLDVTPQRCIEECLNAEYKYAALQSGSLCMCGNTYGRYGFSSSCSDPCLGDFNQNCGGALSNQVYRTAALDSGGWAFGSPSSGSGNVDDKECMVYKCEQFYGWTWQNEKCERKFKYICMFDYDNTTCTARRLIPTAETCIGYSEDVEASWFVAAEDCRTKGGRLLEVLTPLSHYSIRTVLKDDCWLDALWIGATKVEWTWSSGAPLRYTKWATAMPQNEGHKCVAMSYRVSFDYEWSDLRCDRPQNFVCQKPSIPVVTAPSTTRRSTTPSTTTSTTTITTKTTSITTPTTTRSTTRTTPSTTPTTTASTSTTTSPPTRPSTTITTTQRTPQPTPRQRTEETTISIEQTSTVSSTISSTKSRGPPVITEPGAPPRETSTKKQQGVSPGVPSASPSPPVIDASKSNGTDSESPYQAVDQIPTYVGIAAAVVVVLLIIVFVIYKCRNKYRKRKEKMAPTKMENGYTNRAGFIHDGDFAYANVTPSTPKNGISNGGVVDKKRNGFDRSSYPTTIIANPADTPVNVVPPTNVTDKPSDDVPDNMTSTLTTGSVSHRDNSDADASSVNSASSAYIGELDDQGVSVQYVHPRDENLDQSNQPTLPREQAFNKVNGDTADDSHSSNIYPGSNDSLIKNHVKDTAPAGIRTKADLTTRL